MSNWIPNIGNNDEEVSSIAMESGQESPEDSIKKVEPKEAITQLGSSYEIKEVTVSKKSSRPFPTALLALIVIAPLIFIFAMGVISSGDKKEDDSFLFNTLESEYFSLSIDPEYSVDSVIDKKVPFLERHILTNTVKGQKTLTIMIKDVKFDYSVEDNLGAKARKDNPNMYRETSFELGGRKGLYFRKIEENFEHFILLVDRDRSVLYEITMNSPTSFATDLELDEELNELLSKITFL